MSQSQGYRCPTLDTWRGISHGCMHLQLFPQLATARRLYSMYFLTRPEVFFIDHVLIQTRPLDLVSLEGLGMLNEVVVTTIMIGQC